MYGCQTTQTSQFVQDEWVGFTESVVVQETSIIQAMWGIIFH
jgi:hypothetical protein